MSAFFFWKIRDIENTANEANNRLHELDSIKSDVARLECEIREARADRDGLRIELEATKERLNEMQRLIESIKQSNETTII